MNNTALMLIKRHEGLKLSPYLDTLNKLTIGYGRCLDTKGITESEAQMLLANDIEEAEADLQSLPCWKFLNEARQAVLIDMRFNLGGKGLRTFTHFLAALDAKDYEAAAEEMLASKWASQVKGRAVELAKIIKSGDMGCA